MLFSYTAGGEIRILLAKIHTPNAGAPSIVRYSVVKVSNDGSAWSFQNENITLVDSGGAQVATNPHGVAQVGDTLYIVDYDAHKIWFVGVTTLDSTVAPGTAVQVAGCIDLSEDVLGVGVGLPPDAKGQGIIYLQNPQNESDDYLFALYIRNNPTSGTPSGASILMGLTKDGTGAFEFNARTAVGVNAQEIIPVTGLTGTRLLIPAIGGRQESNLTNGEISTISMVDPFAGTLPTPAPVIIEGDYPAAAPTETGTYDIAAIAAQAKSGGIVYILTFTFGPNYKSLFWKLYKTTVDALTSLVDVTLTLSEMEADTDDFTLVDSGKTPGYPDGNGYAGLSYWDILYENGVDSYDQGRLWFRRNGVRITSAADYGNPSWFFGLGVDRGQIGGENINSLELTCETLRQITAGFSGKRGFKIAAPRVKAQALKVKARSISIPEPEENK